MSTNDSNGHQLQVVGRALGGRFSTAVVLFHSAVAERLGINVTDWKCAEILARIGPTNPGKLSEMTGMTTAATTQVINRLEKAGFVKRERDPNDKRKVILHVVPNPQMERIVGFIFAQLGQEMSEQLAEYSPVELEIIQDFVERTTEVLEKQSFKLRNGGLLG